MNFGKYSVNESLEHHFELEPEWFWRVRPVTSADELAMAKFYVDNTSYIMVDGVRVEQPPLWIEVMYREIALAFDGTNIPKQEGKKTPVLNDKSSLKDIEAVLLSMPEKMVEEIWVALGEVIPFWGPRLYQREPSTGSPSEPEAGTAN